MLSNLHRGNAHSWDSAVLSQHRSFIANEDENQDQDVDGRGNHATNDGRTDRLHHIGANAGFPDNWDKTGKNSTDCHQHMP